MSNVDVISGEIDFRWKNCASKFPTLSTQSAHRCHADERWNFHCAFNSGILKVCPGTERSDWEDWINRDRAEIAHLTAEITLAEAQIDAIVYDLFDLTPDEIALLESAI